MPRKPNDTLPIEPYFRALPGCEGILHAIAAEPDDDTHRLVLADWLEEHGEAERAEFIRLQCQLADISEWVAWMLPDEPLRRALHLEATNRKHWARRLGWAGFARGVLEGVWLSGFRGDWIKLLSQARKKINIRWVIADLKPEDWDVFGREVLASLPLGELDLRMHGPLGAGEMAALINAPCFAGLRMLKIFGVSLDPAAARVLAGATAPNLTSLSIDYGVGNEGTAILAKAQGFPRLQHLCLRHNFLTSDGALALATQPLCDSVVSLDLAHNLLKDAGLAALASSRRLSRLRALNLRQNHIGPEGARTLARSSLLTHLTHLCLHDNHIGGGVAALASSPNSAGLESLELQANAITSEQVQHLTGSPTWSGLVSLNLGHNDINDAALMALAGGLSRIEWLSVTGNWIGPAGLSALMSSARLDQLKRLDLGDNVVGNEGARLLADCAALGKLRHLELHNCDIGAEGMLALAESPHLSSLTSLDVRYNRGTKEARAALRARYPGSGA